MNTNKIKIAAMRLVSTSKLSKQEKLDLLEVIKDIDDLKTLTVILESYCLDKECSELLEDEGEEDEEETLEEKKGMIPLVYRFFRKERPKVVIPPPASQKIEKSKRISPKLLRFRPTE